MRKFLVLCLALVSYSAFADEGASAEARGSEYYYQAEGGHFEITPSTFTTLQGIKYNDTNSGYKSLTAGTVTTPIGAEFEYGITNDLAVGLNLFYQDGRTGYKCDDSICPDNTTAKGLMDPEIYLKGATAIGSGALHYGGTLEVAIEKHKIKDSKGDANAAAGGMALTPYVGYDHPLWRGYIGGKVSYQAWLGNRQGTDPAGDSLKMTGGDVGKLAVFYEMNFNIMTYGVSITHARYQENHWNGGQERDALNESLAEFYFAAHFTPNVTLLPVVGLGAGTYTSSSASADSEAIFKMGLGCRFVF